MVQGSIHNPIFQIHKQKNFSMSELSNCERNSLKSFINILKAYGLDQQRESNIVVVESFRLKTKFLAYQLEQGGHLKVTKEKLQELEVDQQNLNSIIAIEDLQQLEHQGSDPCAINEKIGTQDSNVNVKRQLKMLAIDQLYNQKFKKFLCYHWVQSSIICR
jgi:hypothetical protein